MKTSSLRWVWPSRGPVESGLPIKSFALKMPRPHILDRVEDKLDVNFRAAHPVVIMDFKFPICIDCRAIFRTRTGPTGYKEVLVTASDLFMLPLEDPNL